MTIFHVLKYSPFPTNSKADAYDLCRRLPLIVLIKWFLYCFDNDMIMPDPKDMKDAKFRNDTLKGIYREYNIVWFIDSIDLNGKITPAFSALKKILLEYEE